MSPTDSTLAEQVGLHEAEIEKRLEMLGVTSADIESLIRTGELLHSNYDAVIDTFYSQQVAIREVALIIGDAESLRRLKVAQRAYITELFSGVYDQDYVNNRLRIGLVHKRIGVEPKYFLTAAKTLRDTLIVEMGRAVTDRDEFEAARDGLDKILNFDTQIIFDAYIRSLISEVESSRQRIVEHTRELHRKVEERTAELAESSRTDFLTNLMNRRAFREELRAGMARARRHGHPISLLCMDLDDFKQLNDSVGHAAGDKLLARFVSILMREKRETDVACRLGGDEFCALLPDTDRFGAERLVERFERVWSEELGHAVSCGIASTGPDRFLGVDALFDQADAEMYAVKQRRKGVSEEVSSDSTSIDASDDAETPTVTLPECASSKVRGARPKSVKQVESASGSLIEAGAEAVPAEPPSPPRHSSETL